LQAFAPHTGFGKKQVTLAFVPALLST
jgi:hypothetical protein